MKGGSTLRGTVLWGNILPGIETCAVHFLIES